MKSSCGLPTPSQSEPPNRANVSGCSVQHSAKAAEREDRLIHRPAHGCDAAHFVDRGPTTVKSRRSLLPMLP